MAEDQISRRQHEPGWPLLHLPAPGAAIMTKHLALADSKSLRLVCKAAQALVESHATKWQLRLAPGGAQAQDLAQRLPRVTHLFLLPPGMDAQPGDDPGFIHYAPPWPNDFSIGNWDSWPAVTHVHLPNLPNGCVAALLAGFPNASHCALGRRPGAQWYSTPEQLAADNVRAACSTLPGLQGLWPSEPLHNEELQLVAGCSKLTSLKALLMVTSTASWAALMGMKQLAALDITVDGATPPPAGVLTAVQQMTALTTLAVHAAWGDDEEEEPDVTDCQIQLPQSIVLLRLGSILFPPNAVLPHMTRCSLDPGTVNQAALAALEKCPLVSLTVGKLHLTTTCHATPLSALTRLEVTQEFGADAGSQLAVLAPQLAELKLCCDCDLAPEAALFTHMTALQHLDGREGQKAFRPALGYDWLPAGLALSHQQLQDLASTASLQQLRLNALPEHIRHWNLLLSAHQLVWVVGEVSLAASQAVAAAMRLYTPANLQSASFVFVFEADDMDGGSSHNLWRLESKLAFGSIVDAVIMTLAQAQQLSTVHLTVDAERVAAMTEMRLWSLIANKSITNINIVGPPLELSARFHMHLNSLCASRGLQVVVTSPQ